MKTLKGVEVFAVGKWNGMTFQAHDLAEMATAFDELKEIHKVPLKMGHNAEQPMTDGKPALGWVSAIYVKGDKLCADFENVPPVVAKAIENKLYRRVSIELSIDVRYKGKHIPFVVDAVALLGADLPAVNTLADLNAFLSRDAAEFSVAKRAAFSAVAGSIPEAKQMDKKELQDAIDAAVAPLKVDFAKLEDANKALTTENTALKQQVETFKTKEAKAIIDGKRARAKAVFEGLVASGIMTPAAREGFTKGLGIDDDKRLEALDIEAIVAGLGVKESTGADGKVAFTKPGAGDTEKPADTGTAMTFEDAQAALDKRTNELMSEKKLDYSAAKQLALSQDNKLAAAYAAGPG
jgi:hypothetical protein